MAKTAKTKKIAHGTGVCALAFKMIRDGKNNEQVLVAIEKKFPESRLGSGGVSWCRNKLRKNGEKGIKTNLEILAAANKKKPASKKKYAKDVEELAA